MSTFNVRIDVCFCYEVEADNEAEAIEKAEELLDGDQTGGRITETIAFGDA